jgi:hypothetical protein
LGMLFPQLINQNNFSVRLKWIFSPARRIINEGIRTITICGIISVRSIG